MRPSLTLLALSLCGASPAWAQAGWTLVANEHAPVAALAYASGVLAVGGQDIVILFAGADRLEVPVDGLVVRLVARGHDFVALTEPEVGMTSIVAVSLDGHASILSQPAEPPLGRGLPLADGFIAMDPIEPNAGVRVEGMSVSPALDALGGRASPCRPGEDRVAELLSTAGLGLEICAVSPRRDRMFITTPTSWMLVSGSPIRRSPPATHIYASDPEAALLVICGRDRTGVRRDGAWRTLWVSRSEVPGPCHAVAGHGSTIFLADDDGAVWAIDLAAGEADASGPAGTEGPTGSRAP